MEMESIQERSSTAQCPAVNHAQAGQPWLMVQAWFPVSLEIKDTEVRAYRTDHVQVRS